MRDSVKLASIIVFLGMAGYNLSEKFFAYYLNGSPLSLSPAEISVLVIVIYAFLAFSNMFSGILVERYGLRKCMSLGILAYAPFTFVLAFSAMLPGAYTLLLLSAALVGIGGGAFWTALWVFVLRSTGSRGETTCKVQAASLLGTALASLFGGLLLLARPAVDMFFIGGFLIIASAIMALAVEDKRPSSRIAWSEQARLFKDKRLVSLGFIQFVCCCFSGLSISLLPLVITELPSIVPPALTSSTAAKGLEVGLVTFVLYLLGVLSSLFAGRASDVNGRKRFFYAILLLGGLSSLIIAASTEVWMVLLGIVVYGPFLWLAIAMVVASVGDMFPERQGLALAVTGFIGTMGVAVGGLIAAIGSLDSLRLPFIAVACLFLASTLLVKKLPID